MLSTDPYSCSLCTKHSGYEQQLVFIAFFYCISSQPNLVIELELHHIWMKMQLSVGFLF